MPKALKWVVGPAALAAVLAWIASGEAATAASPAPSALPAYAASSIGAAVRQDLSRAAQASAAHETERIVRERNQPGQRERASFQADGWELVKAPPPEPGLTSLDPALLDGREDDLRVQIASTVAAPEQAGRLAAIARGARKPETRTAAVEALGRIGGPEAQHELFALLTDAGFEAEDPARRAIAPLLRPAELGEPYAADLAAQLDSARLTAAERKQIAFTLALVGLRDGTELPPAIVKSLSPGARELLQSMRALATQ